MAVKILVVSHTYPLNEESGITPFVHQISREAAGQGYEVHALVPEHEELEEFEDVEMHTFEYSSKDSIEYHEISDEKSDISAVEAVKYAVNCFRAARGLDREHGFDILHAHWAVPSGVPAAWLKRLRGKPLVIHSHGRDVYNVPEAGYDVPSHPAARLAIKFALKSSDVVIANSTETAEKASELGAGRTEVLPFGVNLEKFSPENSDDSLRPDCCSPADTFLLYAGRLVERKGVQDLIEAIKGCGEEVCLGIIGKGPYRGELEDRASGMENVEFLGYQEHSRLASYMATSDVVVVPSLVEPFGIVNIEALASGTPVVASDTGGMRDIVDGEVGRRFEPGDVQGLRERIEELAADPELVSELSENARGRAVEEYTWETFGKKLADIYSSI